MAFPSTESRQSHLLPTLALALTILAASSTLLLTTRQHRRRRTKTRTTATSPAASNSNDDHTNTSRVVRGVQGLIGDTPLMRIESLSDLTHCEILGKCEFLNPAGSPKDRVALQILLDAEASSLISPGVGDCIFEGTVGSTGISIATLCRARGYRCSIVLPDDVAIEKSQLLQKLGAEVKKVRPRAIVDRRHFVNEARTLATTFSSTTLTSDNQTQYSHQTKGTYADASPLSLHSRDPHESSTSSTVQHTHRPARGFFADQFETASNFTAHYSGTGPEIWAQCGGATLEEIQTDEEAGQGKKGIVVQPQLDIFVAGAGTGGTLSGVAAALRQREDAMRQSASKRQATKTDRGGRVLSGGSLWRMLTYPWSKSYRSVEEDDDERGSPAPKAPIRIVLADPQGSGLLNKVKHGVLYSSTEAEGTRRRHQVDSIVEGIGMNRVTKNLSQGIQLVDDAIRVTDEEAVRISRWLSVRDGLFLGSSSAVNVAAAVKSAIKMREQWKAEGKAGRPTVVTILCDSGVRHLSKFHNDEVLAREYGIQLPEDSMDIDISDMLKP